MKRSGTLTALLITMLMAGSTSGILADPWADQVISYTPGTNAAVNYTLNAAVVLGSPERVTGETSGFPSSQVSSFNGPFGADEILSIGAGGELIVKFDEPVYDNPLDVSFGIDLLVFGNAFFVDSGGNAGGVTAEPGTIQVSQTGLSGSWFDITDVFADSLFPTEGYTDASGRYASDGVTESDFTIPVDPSFDPIGKSYSQIVAGYNGSGGGAGVDIASTGLAWIQYVRVYQDANDSWSTEIDAFADVVPEPASLMLAGVGLALVVTHRNKRA